uniref:CRISPR-associated endoribonuclease Cas2 n=1 Tax=Candidatus Kentrum sp. FW TaxID=2126338 RepID=A0A450TDP5_9GAMM|nr:MAG: CRISPR-associated protein, Cas2 family [Candidatus Kentron sp. FW]VFJ65090.1 MAG: CRISPR-associated protein, Cas2 family [Candidatus Kentron sp. FW]
MTHLSGYRIMWLMVLFDLPVVEREERRAYTRFRNYLLDRGFAQAQYSVYVRHTTGKEAAEALIHGIEKAVPHDGKVDILLFTDKQYENIVSFRGKANKFHPKNPDQLVLF